MKHFIFILACFIVFIPINYSLAYAPLTTHSGLTENVANFYNFSASKKITDTQMEWLIQGSQNEDNGLRCLNHAYDPIYNRGWHLSLINTDIGYTSKEWSQSENAQISYGAMDLSSIKNIWQSLWLGPNNLDSNQTWNKAIYEYLSGHEKEAFIALGHVLHLIEDATVPSHVRANSHPDILGKYSWSDYEERAKVYDRAILKNYAASLQKQGLSSPKFNNLNNLFDDLAGKVNHYYYSDDTIRSSEYKYPQPEYEGKLLEGYFVMGQNHDGDTIHLAYKQPGIGYRVESGLDIYTLNNDFVFKDYWQSLSPLAVSYGSSAIDLFFQDVQKAAQEKDYLTKNNQSALTKLAASLLDLTIDLNNEESIASTATYPEATRGSNSSESSKITTSSTLKTSTSNTKVATTSTTKKVVPTTVTTKRTTTTTTIKKPTTTTKVVTTTTTKPIVPTCIFNSTNEITNKTVIFNEIAWMGSAHSPNDEWIELRNISSQNIDISGWQIISRTGNIKVVIPNETIILADSFYLLERTDDTSVPYTQADLIYTGSLNNINDGLKLFTSNCLVADSVLASSDWPAGNAEYKRSMERGDNLTWHTYSYANAFNNILGTPKASNSPSGWQVPNTSQSNGTSASTTTSSTTTTLTTISTTTTLPKCDYINNINLNPKVIFNEIAWMGSPSSPNDEWIELKNISSEEIDLSHWQILDRTGHIKIDFSTRTSLSAGQMFLLERTNDNTVPTVSANLIYTGAINNENETLSLYNANCELEDQVVANPGWPSGSLTTFNSMERGDDLTWHTYCGTVGNSSPNQENSTGCVITTTTTTTTKPVDPGSDLTPYPSLEWNWLSSNDPRPYLKVKKSELLTPIGNQEVKAVVFYLNQDVPAGDKYDYISWSQPNEWAIRQGDNQKALILAYSGSYSVTSSTALIFKNPVVGQLNSNNSRNYQDYYQENIWVENSGYIDDFGSHGFAEQPLTQNDYVTVGTYGLVDDQTHLKLLKADNYHHYFGSDYFEVPGLDIQSFSLQYDPTIGEAKVKFKPAIDKNVSPQFVNYAICLDSHEGREMTNDSWCRYFSADGTNAILTLDQDGYYNGVLKNSEFDTGDDRFKDTTFYGAIFAIDELSFRSPKSSLGSIQVPKIIQDQQPLSDYVQNVQLHFQSNLVENSSNQHLFLDFDIIRQPVYPSLCTNFFLTFKWHNLNDNNINGLLSIPWETFCPSGQYCGGEISYGSRGIPFENKHYSILLTNISKSGGYTFQNNEGLTPSDLASLGITDLSQIKLDISYETASSNGDWYFITPKLN